MVRNFILDWSGTLVDDLPAVWQATNYVLTMAGRKPLTLEEFRHEFALPFTVFYEKFTPDVPFQLLEKWFHDGFSKYQESVRAVPYSHEFLAFCREFQIKTYVLSAVRPDYFERQYRAAGFQHRFDGVYLNVFDKRAEIHRVLSDNGLNPSETVFVGDMCHDIESARVGGIGAVAVLTGYNSEERLRASEPDLVVSHLGELVEFLRAHCLHWPFCKTEGDASYVCKKVDV